MISIVSNNQVVNLLILLPYTFVLRAHSFMYPKVYEISNDDSFLSQWVFSLLGDNALIHSIISAFLIYGIAVVIGNLTNKYRLYQRQNLYAPYFFVLLASLISEVLILSPVLIGLVFFTLFLRSSLMIYRNHLGAFEIFNMGLLAMIAGLLYVPFMILIIASLLAVIFFEGLDFKAVLLLLFGFAAATIIIYSSFFFFDLQIANEKAILGISTKMTDMQYWTFDRILYAGVISLIIVFVLSRYFNFLKKKIIDARKRITFLFLLAILILTLPFFFISTDIYFFLIGAFMSAVFMSFFFDNLRNNVVLEVIHLFLIITLFGFQFNLINI